MSKEANKLFLTAVIFAALMAACGGADTPAETGTDDDVGGGNGDVRTCTSDDECLGEERCIGGICTTIECTSNSDCDEGFLCKEYQCKEKTTGKACSSNDECAGDRERCIEGHCIEADCLTNKECQKGFSCDPVSYICVEGIAEGSPCSEDSECSDDQTCYKEACTKTCKSNDDCKEGEICEQTTFGKMVCMPDVECRVDSDCGGGMICRDNMCIADTSCKTNDDCADAVKKICDMTTGECVECLTSSDCGPGGTKICNPATGMCEEKVVGCKSDLDCQNPATPICDVNSGTCIPKEPECKKDEDCTNPTKPKCNTTLGICVADTSTMECRSNADCMEANKKLCETRSGICVQCLGDFDCEVQYVCNNYVCEFSAGGDTCPYGTTCQSSKWGPACLTNVGQPPDGTPTCDANDNCAEGQTRFDQMDAFGNTTCVCPLKCVNLEGECDACSIMQACRTGLNCSGGLFGGFCQRTCKNNADCTRAGSTCVGGYCSCN
ncbi:MAG: hypothetical protein Kow0090_00180 [Myxococcota bacterium]